MKKILKRTIILTIVLEIIIVAISFSKNTFAETKNFPSIKDIVPAKRFLGNYVYVTGDEMKYVANILCTTSGIHLPREHCAVVELGKKSTKVTRSYKDSSGKTHKSYELAYLDQLVESKSAEDRNELKNLLVLESDSKFQKTTTSETYAKLQIVGEYQATPLEAWVLQETENNEYKSGAKTYQYKYEDNHYWEYTNQAKIDEYCRDKYLVENTNGIDIWAIWDDNSDDVETFITQIEDGTYYEMYEQESGKTYSGYSYVQHAWWNTKKVGTPNAIAIQNEIDNKKQKTDLEYEARDFENYIKKVALFKNEANYRERVGSAWTDKIEIVKYQIRRLEWKDQQNSIFIESKDPNDKWAPDPNWQWNDDNTIKLDPEKLAPKCNAKDVQVTFNALTNQYVIGPISLDYVRAATQQGYRNKVEFSGITGMQLYGLDSNGNRLLDTNNESALQLKTSYRPNGNYEIIYAEGAEGHKAKIPKYTKYIDGSTQTGLPIDTEDEYPFPYPGEEFYIAVNYMDDMVAIDSLDIDFKYTNAGAKFQYLGGRFYKFTWEPTKEKIDGKYSLRIATDKTKKAKAQDLIVVSQKSQDVIDVNSATASNPAIVGHVLGNMDLCTRIAGTVWIDELPQKDGGEALGTKESREKTAPENSVEVVVWKVKYDISGGVNKATEVSREKAVGWTVTKDKDNKDVRNPVNFIDDDKRVFIDKDGKYEVLVPMPSEEKIDPNKYRVAYDVEFVYDGQTYEATEYLKSATGKTSKTDKTAAFKKTIDQTKGTAKDYSAFALDSYAVENADDRAEFDQFFAEISGNTPMNLENNTTKGKATGSTVNNAIANNQYESVEYDGNNLKEIELNYNTIDGETGVNASKKSELITKGQDGKILNQYKFSARTSEGGMIYPYEALSTTPYYHFTQGNYDNYVGIKQYNKTFKPLNEYFTQINLGLVERNKVDISVLKDLYKAKVVVNEQETDYTYNSWGELTADNLKHTVAAGYRNTTYTIGLYNSDYNYRSSAYSVPGDVDITKKVLSAIKDESELRLFITYKISINNESEFSKVSINEFKDYYNKALTLVGYEEVRTAGEYEIKQDEKGNYVGIIGQEKVQNQDGIEKAEYVREEKVIAETPYFRKIKANADQSTIYKWNKADDCNSETNTGVALSGELNKADNKLVISDVTNTDYKCATINALDAVSIGKDTITKNDAMTLAPNEKFEVFVTYEVDQARFKEIQEAKANNQEDDNKIEQDATKELTELLRNSSVAELTKYSSFYGSDEPKKHATTSIKEGAISGKIDHDSAPDNLITSRIEDKAIYEDDSQGAPVVTIGVKGEDRREVSGVAWEDYRADRSEGDGIYTKVENPGDDNDKPIPGMDVTLVEKISISTEDLERIKAKNPDLASLELLDYEFEYVWPDGSFNITNIEGEDGQFKSHKQTNENGEYKFTNMVAGNYVVRFEYGNNEETSKYNGQDYKNTAYQVGMTNQSAQINEEGVITKGTVDGTTVKDDKVVTLAEANIEGTRTTLNNQWHDLSDNRLNGVKVEDGKAVVDSSLPRVSDARDYEPRRLQVNAYSRTITNKNAEVLASGGNIAEYNKDILGTDEKKAELLANTSMVANTAKFAITIEPQSELVYDEQTMKTTADGTVQTHDYKVVQLDFGLVRRPETRLNIQKEISKLELLKNDDSEVILSVTMDEDGNIIKDGSGVMVDKVKEIKKDDLVTGGQGFKYVDMEASVLDGAKLELTYDIKVYNNSEDDYVTEHLARTKNMQALFDMATQYESTNYEHKIGDQDGLSPFSTGKGIVYGEVVGLHYYTNGLDAYNNGSELDDTQKANLVDKYNYEYDKEIKVATTVDQLVDYVDNDLSRNIDGTTGIVNQSWDDSTQTDRNNKLSVTSYMLNDRKSSEPESRLLDNKGRRYIDTSKNNIAFSKNEVMNKEPVAVSYTKTKFDEGKLVTKQENGYIIPDIETISIDGLYTTNENATVVDMYNPELTREIEPGQSAIIKMITSQGTSGQNMDNMNYDNLVEIAMYSNSVGRRDMASIPGNANMIAKERPAYGAGYNKVGGEFIPKQADITVDNKVYTINTEPDAYAAKDTVVFSEPTGLSLQRETANTIIRIILVSLIIAAVAIISTIIVMVLKKSKTYDDKDLTE